ncbi:YbfB/YjiJ family MFS transporter [Alcaligenaceae bacterium]|nr:YbfB/YjiJ family MFS transporter [Alcaligenaceae bacterium]
MQSSPSAFQLSFAGFIALAVVMGIGRFAFTPLLPMMQNDTGLNLAQGGWLASANYLGYLVGALMAARLPWPASLQLRAGLFLVFSTTMLMGITSSWSSWLAWRFIAGAASAWVLVSTASLCIPRLTALGQPQRAGVVFAGVGFGVAAAGLLCMALDLADISSSQAWVILGGVALVASAGARNLWLPMPPLASPTAQANVPTDNNARTPAIKGYWALIICYGLFGFGYILPATFLPAQAKQLVADPALFGLAWPLFGLAAAISTLLTSRLAAVFQRRTLWAAAQLIMAAGVLLPVIWPSLAAIAIAAICVGGTFMVITMLGMQEAQAVGGASHARKLMAALTAAFAAGQLAGPTFFSLTHTYFSANLGFALILACAGLVLSSALLLKSNK